MALSREQKKLAALRRAQRRLQHRLEDIDWELDELQPELKSLGELQKAEHVTLELDSGDLDEDRE